ncbi:hypothetical protein DL98DRAFT_536824 [Cadophora sp. DSE1049]|nr:hypothetical protein DL98DRAFT_536824 [Cadophora sp. DSE1049]
MSDLAKQPLAYFLQEQRVTKPQAERLNSCPAASHRSSGSAAHRKWIRRSTGKQWIFGPTSAPVVWSGELKDPIPVEANGILTTARIMTDEDAKFWNRIFDLNIRIRKYNSRIEEEEDDIERYRVSLQRYADHLTTDPEHEANLRRWIKQIEDRCSFLQSKIESCEAEAKSLNRKLGRRALHFMLKSSLRKKEDPKPWVEEIFQNLRKDVDASVVRFDRRIEDERTVDMNDSDDESTLAPQQHIFADRLVKNEQS